MTNDEIKELAWTAGATIRHTAGLFQLSYYRATHFGFSLEALTKFAELIQARAVPKNKPAAAIALLKEWLADSDLESFKEQAKTLDEISGLFMDSLTSTLAAAQKGSV